MKVNKRKSCIGLIEMRKLSVLIIMQTGLYLWNTYCFVLELCLYRRTFLTGND